MYYSGYARSIGVLRLGVPWGAAFDEGDGMEAVPESATGAMEEAFLVEDADADCANGRYAAFGDDNRLVAQGDHFGDVVDRARALGHACPAIIDLDDAPERIYVF